MSDTTLWTELLASAPALAFRRSTSPCCCCCCWVPNRSTAFVAGVLTTLVAATLLVTVGHALVLDMSHGSHHRTGLDLPGGWRPGGRGRA